MHESSEANSIFSIAYPRKRCFPGIMLNNLAGPIELLTGLSRLNKLYRKVETVRDPGAFIRQSLALLNIFPVVHPRDKVKIPSQGPCLVIANHPFGAIEGMVLADMLLGIRPDVKIMTNFLLDRIPQLRPLTIPVDPFEGNHSVSANIRPLREALRWVSEGGLLVLFPAGEVSQYDVSRRAVADPPWKNSAATIIRHARPSVVPIFFPGRNSLLFQMTGFVHPRMRTLLLVRELLGKAGRQIHYRIGNPIHHGSLAHFADDGRLLDYLRWRIYIMGHGRRKPLGRSMPETVGVLVKKWRPIAKARPRSACRQDIDRLPLEQKLIQTGAYSVWQAEAFQIPNIIREIGRLREMTFRLAGEGTNKPIDLDRFDAHYLHLFLWHAEANEIVGAFRIGPTIRILAGRGKKGLYTDTLFQSEARFFEKLGPALELGRSFVRPEYQKTYWPLLLLLKGIGAIIARNPIYRTLFGAVSISSEYSDLSRRLLANHLMNQACANDLSVMVEPRRPVSMRPMKIRGCDDITQEIRLRDFEEVRAVISDIEAGEKDVPVLLRHYLSLGGKFLSFNIDKSFSGVMDGLIVVDLMQTGRKALERYLGKDGAAGFLAYHRNSPEQMEALQTSA